MLSWVATRLDRKLVHFQFSVQSVRQKAECVALTTRVNCWSDLFRIASWYHYLPLLVFGGPPAFLDETLFTEQVSPSQNGKPLSMGKEKSPSWTLTWYALGLPTIPRASLVSRASIWNEWARWLVCLSRTVHSCGYVRHGQSGAAKLNFA